MAFPTHSITLEVEQIEDLSRHFSGFRHDVNGCLSLIVAAAELIRYNPDVSKRMSATLVEQPPRIAGKLVEFIEQCERVLGLRGNGPPGWYPHLWKRSNAAPSTPPTPVAVAPEAAKMLHNDLLQLGKEFTQLAFTVSGARLLASAYPDMADDVSITAAGQLAKVGEKYDQLSSNFEELLRIEKPAAHRLASGTPSGPVTLSPEQLELFHRKLMHLQEDVVENLKLLLEMARVSRTAPEQLQTRSVEFAQQPPRISADLAKFAAEFDQTFAILRT